jgi:hypothetical protein
MPATTIHDGHRPCSRCREIKLISAANFHRNARKTDGFSATCRECFKAIDRKRNQQRKVKRSAQSKAHYEKTRERKLALSAAWKAANRRRSYALDARSLRKRLARDPVFKFSRQISKSIRRTMNGLKRGKRWEIIVGYIVHELRQHLEAQFEDWMTWDNYGTWWHIDHRRPIAAFGLPSMASKDEIVARAKECWALSNLRPLEAKANMRKGARWDASPDL